MERSHAECSRNLFRYTDKCSRLLLDRYSHTEGKCCVERHDHSNHLSKSITVHMERSHANCSWNLFGYPDQCRRLRFDRYVDLKCHVSPERYDRANDLSKSIAIYLERSHADRSWNIL